LLRQLQAVPGLYLVGGYLREAWWQRDAHDIDLIAGGEFQAGLTAIQELTGVRAIKLNQRFESYRFAAEDWLLDVSPLHDDGLAADINRRDYTVNTLAVPLKAIGPDVCPADIQGHPLAFDDLNAYVLRMVERENLKLDPARILRGYRLAACHGLTPDAETRAAWRTLAGGIVSAAPERLHEELLRWMDHAGSVVETVRWCAEDEVLWALFPPLRAMVGCGQNEYHHLDVWEHTLEALGQLDIMRDTPPPMLVQWREQFSQAWEAPISAMASAGTLTRFALLLHDAGKPQAREVQADGRVTFYGHQEAGVELAAPLLEWLRCATDESQYIKLLVLEHLRLGFYSDHNPVPRRLIYRFITNLGDATPLMILHTLADCAAHRGELAEGSFARHEIAAAEILAHYYAADVVAAPPLLLDGHEIMQLLDLAPGPQIGRLKSALLEATAAGEVLTVDAARDFVRELHAQDLSDA
jgi:tRNA nucleotidyltransferase/poly(A) polymerase